MLGKNHAQRKRTTGIDGGDSVGVPLGGRDDRPPTGYQHTDDEWSDGEPLDDVEPLIWDEDEDAADRRRDPLRR